MDLITFNPWWRDGRVSAALVGRKRRLLAGLSEYMGLRQMLILYGLRRVGKTTTMFQLIDGLLEREEADPYHILYFSFDEEKADIKEILAAYERQIIREDLPRDRKTYLFLDEVQKLDDWPDKVKVIYDMYPSVKLCLSGSAAIAITKGVKESLAGRFFETMIEPLDFDEYLEFSGDDIDREQERVFELRIRRRFEEFMANGGFIEALELSDSHRNRYFKEGLLERVIYRDLPDSFHINAPDLLYRCMRVCAEKPGMLLDYSSLGRDLGHDQRTIAAYFSHLEYALLANKLYNYSPNLLTSEKKMKKVYLSSTAFSVALSPPVGRPELIEQFFANVLKARFFSRTPQRDEVDLVLSGDGEVVPIEVKIRSEVKKRDATPLFKFLHRYKAARGYMISDGTETVFSDGEKEVEVIPYWMYWTLMDRLGGILDR
ncbi:MAG: ATP-binding protein [Actinobacteria bacterium]|nr:ATP-binding protein [Actinomycetota bacterium]MBU2688294.1 ATP-binding protein [Actinomycetota bacterium]